MKLLLSDKWLMEPRTLIGIMTGNSLDGIDTAICRFEDSLDMHHYDLLAYEEYEFPTELRAMLLKIISEPVTIKEISQANIALSQVYADCIEKITKKHKIAKRTIDAVGIHGQTVLHNPSIERFCEYDISSTLQLGSGQALAQLVGLPVVSDFRINDIMNGGQGAPLVPIFDYNFMRSDAENRILLNIGGIANITYIPAGCLQSEIRAFDTGPGNMLIDFAVFELFGMKFDTNGYIASKGKVIPELFERLKALPFISQKPPKSTGRELFNKDLIADYLYTANPEDLIRTLTEFTAYSIVENIKKFAPGGQTVYISGGGGKNLFLIELMENLLPKIDFFPTEYCGIDSNAKEAGCFAYLAYRTIGGLHSNIPSVTGAKKSCTLGTLSLP
jgi:anhydro-N-acetylmuramic acid kinase